MMRRQYADALSAICSHANQQVAALQLTTAMSTWRSKGDRAVAVVEDTVDGFKKLTPPDVVADVAERFVLPAAERDRCQQRRCA